ncbi:MAG: hypothetical protein ACKO0V_15890, partial [bacterium]
VGTASHLPRCPVKRNPHSTTSLPPKSASPVNFIHSHGIIYALTTEFTGDKRHSCQKGPKNRHDRTALLGASHDKP